MSQSNAFLWTKGAAQIQRQSNAFLWVRGAPFAPSLSVGPTPGETYYWRRGQVLPVSPVGSETLHRIRSAALILRGGETLHRLRAATPVAAGGETLHRVRGIPIPGQSVGGVQDARVLTWPYPPVVAGSVSDALVLISTTGGVPSMSVVNDDIVIGLIQPLDPNARAPDEQKIDGVLDPKCVGTSGGVGAGVKGCENSQGELIRKV